MTIEEVVDWNTTTGDNQAHHPTGPRGRDASRVSLSFREMQAAIARWRDTLAGQTSGSWTPVVSDGTNDCTMNSSTTGRWRKISDVVFISCYILVDSLGSASGDARITGLPETALNVNAGFDYALSVGECSSLANTGDPAVTAQVENNSDYITLHIWDGGAGAGQGTGPMQISEISVNGEMRITGWYISA